MAYEELNEETVVAEETATEAETETVAGPAEEEIAAEITPDEIPTEEVSEADVDLSEGMGEDLDFDFEVEEMSPKSAKIVDAAQQVKDNLQDKYSEARSACKSLMDRLTYDLEQTNYNPYIRSTTTYRYEILRNSKDTEPVDVFEFEKKSGFSLRAMAITTAIVAVADIAVAGLFKKK